MAGEAVCGRGKERDLRMRRNVKQYIKKGLCGILSAAMILTSLSIPELTAYAAGAGDKTQIFEEESGSAADEAQNGAEVENTAPEGTDSANEDAKEAEDNNEEIKEAEAAEDKAEEAETNEDEERIDRESDNRDGTNLIQDGEFNLDNSTGWSGGKFGAWGFINNYWDSVSVKSDGWAAHVDQPAASGNGYGLAVSYKSELTQPYTFELYQTISESLSAGNYKLTAYLKNGTSAKGFHGTAYNTDNLTYNSLETSLTTNWTEVTYEFNIDSAVTNYVIGIAVTASANAWVCVDDVSLVRTDTGTVEPTEPTYTLDQLKNLYNEVQNYQSADYTADSWSDFNTARTAAKSLIDSNSQDSAAITSAYTALENAKNALEKKPREVMLNYYAGDIGTNEVAVYTWSSNGNISFNVDKAAWKPWGNSDAYKMTASTDYPGWYSIPIAFKGDVGNDANFQIFVQSDTNNCVFKCESANNGTDRTNTDIYKKLFSGTETSYAVREYGNTPVLYEGDDATAAMRNVTLNVYSADGTPAIGTSSALAAFNETGAKSTLTASSTADGNNYYDMTPSGSSDGWYSLTFSAPAAAEASVKILGVYTKNGADAYTLVKDFTNTEFADAFTGKLYYKDRFFDTKDAALAGGTTLGMIKGLYDSAEFKAIIANRADYYTTASWERFNTAKTAAEALTNNTTDADNSNVTPAIEAAYKALDEAIKGIAAKPAVTVFYYYNDSIADSEELGATFWAGDNASVDENLKASWSAWSGAVTYKITPVEGHKGWYSIPIAFGSSKNGFDIHKKGASATKVTGVDQAQYPAAANKAFALKGDKYYKGKELAEALVRKVTLYVYDAAGTPAIRSTERLVSADETSQTLTSLTPSENTGSPYNYDMGEVNGKENWYMMTFSAPDASEAGEICALYTHSDSYTLVTKFLNKAAAGEKEFNFSPIFGSEYKGTAYYKEGKFYKSINDADGITYGELKALITEAEKKTAEDYTEATWTAFNTALTTAKDLSSTLASQGKQDTYKDEAITNAHKGLDDAIKDLKLKEVSVTIDFSFYAGDTNGKGVGIYKWSSNITTDAAETAWHPWGAAANTGYKMTQSSEYPGWYTIAITFTGNAEDDANFQVILEDAAASVFNCGKSSNADIYSKFFDKANNNKAYAVKKFGDAFKLYEGEEAESAMRSVTLYAYSEAGTPAIGSKTKLSAVDKTSGAIAELTADKTENAVYYYNMTSVSGKANWYSITFSAPAADASTGEICGLYTFAGNAYTLVTKFLNKAAAGEKEFNFSPIFGAEYKGTAYYKNNQFYASIDDADGITFAQLKALITEAEEKVQSQYTSESWTVFAAKLAAAKALTAQSTVVDITSAYKALEAAMSGLAEKGNELTFNYYAGDVGNDEVAIYTWSDKNNVTFNAAEASWKGWGSQTVYKMTLSPKYKGWYSIPVTFAGAVSDSANFQIFKQSETGTPIFKCGSTGNRDNGGNDAIYNKLFKGTAGSSYAVKTFGSKSVLYEGEADSAAAMRSITLYAYSADAVPAIGSASELKAVNASTGAIEAAAGKNTADGINYYDMTAAAGKPGWYLLSFCAPEAAADTREIASLYTKSGESYVFVKKFVESAAAAADSVNFLEAFKGKVYYNDGEFYASMELAEGITLKMLKDLLASQEIKAIADNGAAKYTASSWSAFEAAKQEADKAVSDCNEAGNNDDYKSEAVTAAYTGLKNAVGSMAEAPKDITFYYYNDSIAADEELGLTIWSSDNSTSAAETYDWYIWKAGDAYKMTPVSGYKGWYSIPIAFAKGGSWPGFEIISHKKGDASGEANVKRLEKYQEATYPDLTRLNASYAVKGGQYYYSGDLVSAVMRNVTMYVYSESGTPALEYSGTLKRVDETTGKSAALPVSGTNSGEGWSNNCYDMLADEMNNWYYLEFSVPTTANASDKICSLDDKAADGSYTWKKDLHNGAVTDSWMVDITPVFGGAVYYKDGVFSSVRALTLADLQSLIAKAQKLRDDDLEAEKLNKNEYYHDKRVDGGKWDAFVEAIESAKAVAGKEAPASDEIKAAYDALTEAMDNLLPSSCELASIEVKKVAVNDDFIMGADLSSYVSVRDSGTVFKDENGNALSDKEFFKLIKDGGTNWVRIRVWNDPYNGAGKGYGGGNSDLAKAKLIGKLATDAGMKVLIDFHYSDFWADPGKQDTPKAWRGYTIENKEKAVYDYTLESLKALKAAGVNVGMVQVGNETNNAVCGEKGWGNMSRIFSAGSRAVKEFDKDCLVAIHFADPSSGRFGTYAENLKKYGVEYDVFAASYYPFWHGTTETLTGALKDIAGKYGKKVMVAETSWVTTWDDGDGHLNTSPKTTQTLYYPVSIQGQADEMRDVVYAVQKVNDDLNSDLAIGVFYWEPAWISPYYAYSGKTLDKSLYAKNQELWEKYGSGWASSYSTEYDPVDAGQWYGGGAVDNQAWFDFNAKALPTVNAYRYIRGGAVITERKNTIDNVEDKIEIDINVGDRIDWAGYAEKTAVTFSDGSKTYVKDAQNNTVLNPHFAGKPVVKWDEKQQAAVHTDKPGSYEVEGILTLRYYEADKDESSIKTATYEVTLELDVHSNGNILINAGFENGEQSWSKRALAITGIDDTADVSGMKQTKEDPRNGSYGMHFYSEKPLHYMVEQTVNDVEAGIYTAGGFIQGNGAGTKDLQTLYVKVFDKGADVASAEPKITYKKTCSLNGWLNWVNPEITSIKVEEDDIVVIGMEILSTLEKAWGTIDDMYLYGRYGIDVSVAADQQGATHGVVSVSSMEADSGEIVRVAAAPENGYYLSEISITGMKAAQGMLKEDSDSAASKSAADIAVAAAEGAAQAAPVTVTSKFNEAEADRSDTTVRASFVMPSSSLKLEAKFEQIAELMPGAPKINLQDVTAKDFVKESSDKYIYKPSADYTGEEYTGKRLELDLELSYKGYKLTSADYAAAYVNNVNKSTDADMAKITIKAKGSKFTGTKELYFRIVDSGKVDISKAKAKLKDSIPGRKDTYYYTGEEIEPAIEEKLTDIKGNVLTLNGADLTLAADDYTVYYEKNIKVGKATMYVIANKSSKKIKGTLKQTFTIERRLIADKDSGAPINDITIEPITGGTYTGSKITPNVIVKYKNKVLQKGRDYTVAYKNNVNVSTLIPDDKLDKLPSVVVTGKGSYTGVLKKDESGRPLTFAIKARSIDDGGIRAVASDIAEGEKPNIALYDGKKKLSEGRHYFVRKIAPKDDGSNVYQVTLEGMEKGGYTGTRDTGASTEPLEYRVIARKNLIASVKIKTRAKTYTGQQITLNDDDLEVLSRGGKILVKDIDYTVSYEDLEGSNTNIKAGRAEITVKGIGSYGGTKKAVFTIARIAMIDKQSMGEAASKDFAQGLTRTSDAQEKALISWKTRKDTLLEKVEQLTPAGEVLELPYTGYAWMPELDVYATIGSDEKLLVKGVDYTISYRKNLKPNDKAELIVKGIGSYRGTVTLKEVFTVKNATLDDFVMTVAPVEYTGSRVKPEINFVYKKTGTQMDVREGAAYTVKYINNRAVASAKSANKPTITIKEKGFNIEPGVDKNQIDLNFTITTGLIKAACVQELKVQRYAGRPVEPKLSVKVSGRSLKAGRDYIVTYTGNNRPNDKAYANIIGIGNYSGTVNKEFVIQ